MIFFPVSTLQEVGQELTAGSSAGSEREFGQETAAGG